MGGCATRPSVRQNAIRSFVTDVPEIIEEENLESYYLFWLDETAKSPEYIETHAELRLIIDHLKIFESNIQCLRKFKTVENGKIYLLINCKQSLFLLPRIHDHKQLHSIYIYHNGDNIDMEQTKTKYRKIKGVYELFYMAKRYLEDDIKLNTDFDEPMVMYLSKDTKDMDYQEKFTLFLKTVHVITKDVHDNQTRKDLIEMCKEYYHGNEREIHFLDEFSRTYKSEQALSWYMRESCLHRLLTHAFNEHNMDLLVDMYSFIVDINQDIQKQNIKETSPLKVVRK